MMTNDDLHALASLAEAATPTGPWFQVQDRVYDNKIVPGQTFGDGFVAEVGDIGRARFIAAASPDVVRELIERVLRAETIVRDLAKTDPTKTAYAYGETSGTECTLCGEISYEDDFPIAAHAESCPWRRAVDLKL